MRVVIIVAARWMACRQALPQSPAGRLAVGLVALSFLLLTEFTVVLWIRKLTIAEYFASRDPVAGTVYVVMLGIFAVMPLLIVHPRPSRFCPSQDWGIRRCVSPSSRGLLHAQDQLGSTLQMDVVCA